MAIAKIFFILLIIICAVFYILYVGDFSLVLLIAVCALPAVMFIIGYTAKKNISVDLILKDKSAAKGEPFDIQLCVSNKSIFPVGRAEAVIDYYNVFNNQINDFQLNFPIQARNSQRIIFQLSSKFCGIVKLSTAYIKIYDPLRIFSFKIGKNICREIAVLPEGHDISGLICSADRQCDESPAYSEFRPGDDPSEVFDLREYAPGDKPNRIHWKLSSKKDEFIVKEYSFPVNSPSAVFLDLHCTEDSEYTLPIYDTLLEMLVSVSQFMLENERGHDVIYFSAAENCFERITINTTEQLAAAVSELIMSISDDLRCASPENYFLDNRNLSLASFTFITAQPDERIFTEIDESLDADVKNALIVVKDADEAAKAESSYFNLNTIPVVIGRISSSVRDIEL